MTTPRHKVYNVVNNDEKQPIENQKKNLLGSYHTSVFKYTGRYLHAWSTSLATTSQQSANTRQMPHFPNRCTPAVARDRLHSTILLVVFNDTTRICLNNRCFFFPRKARVHTMYVCVIRLLSTYHLLSLTRKTAARTYNRAKMTVE